jgi:hypothetical protein
MTIDEARIVVLEDALRQAQNTVEFLHGCLVAPGSYTYAHPGQTLALLEDWASLVPRGEVCFHSGMEPDCPGCVERVNRQHQLGRALTALAPTRAQDD